MPDKTKHLHWTIQAYDEMLENGSMTDVTTIRVEETTQAKALGAAKKIFKARHYRMADVTEICPAQLEK
jgi:hypothetical protein